MNRWSVVAGALLIQLALGAIYAWSVFVNPLKEAYSFSTTETQIIFSLALASFAVTMIFAGRWQDRKGPKIVATAGGIIFGLGFVLGGLSQGNFLFMALGIGLVGGIGLGLSYVCPIAACIKFFPDKRGMITGIAVAGFGAGAWVFAKVAESWISTIGVLNTFLWLGGTFIAMCVIGAQLLNNPPAGFKPKGYKAPVAKAKSKQDFEWREMLKMRQFWLLWTTYMFGAMAGLMVIGNLKPFGVFSGLSPEVAGAAVGILALFNGAGRITWGALSDKLGRNKSLISMFVLQGIMMLGLMQMGSTELLLAIAAAWVGFNYGGLFALYPSATADYFGTKNVGINYGLVFTSYGVAGIVGPILGGAVFDATGSYLWAFIPAGAVCLIAAVLAVLLKPPKQ